MKTIILDHDIGTNPDDFFSLLILLNSEKIHLPLVISGNNFPFERARFAHKIIYNHGRRDVTVVAGNEAGHIDFFAQKYIEGCEPSIQNDYIKEIKNVLDTYKNVAYLCIEGVSNLVSFLDTFPIYKDTFDIIHMGLSTTGAKDYISGGTNMETNLSDTKRLYEWELQRMKVVGSHTTINDAIRVHPQTDLYKKIEQSNNVNHKMLFEHLHDYYSRRGIWPALHDPLTTSVALEKSFVDFEERFIDFKEDGYYRLGTKTKVTISKQEIREKEFMDFCTVYI